MYCERLYKGLITRFKTPPTAGQRRSFSETLVTLYLKTARPNPSNVWLPTWTFIATQPGTRTCWVENISIRNCKGIKAGSNLQILFSYKFKKVWDQRLWGVTLDFFHKTNVEKYQWVNAKYKDSNFWGNHHKCNFQISRGRTRAYRRTAHTYNLYTHIQTTTGKATTVYCHTHCQCITSNCLYHIAVFTQIIIYPSTSYNTYQLHRLEFSTEQNEKNSSQWQIRDWHERGRMRVRSTGLAQQTGLKEPCLNTSFAVVGPSS